MPDRPQGAMDYVEDNQWPDKPPKRQYVEGTRDARTAQVLKQKEADKEEKH